MDVDIKLPRAARMGSVEIDGRKVEGVTRVVVVADVRGTTQVRLTLVGDAHIKATDPDLLTTVVTRREL